MDRQSVPLTLRIFNDKVVCFIHVAAKHETGAALIDGARVFITMILALWKMLKVKHPLKGRNLRDPIRSVADH
jgi:hypothetical protein